MIIENNGMRFIKKYTLKEGKYLIRQKLSLIKLLLWFRMTGKSVKLNGYF